MQRIKPLIKDINLRGRVFSETGKKREAELHGVTPFWVLLNPEFYGQARQNCGVLRGFLCRE